MFVHFFVYMFTDHTHDTKTRADALRRVYISCRKTLLDRQLSKIACRRPFPTDSANRLRELRISCSPYECTTNKRPPITNHQPSNPYRKHMCCIYGIARTHTYTKVNVTYTHTLASCRRSAPNRHRENQDRPRGVGRTR